MAYVRDIEVTPLADKLNHINALLDIGPDWNFVTTSSENKIFYTFSVSSGNEKEYTGQEAFTLAQQTATYAALTYLKAITGIEFEETSLGTKAQLHFANLNLASVGTNVTGLCSWEAPYSSWPDGILAEYNPDAYVYLDNNRFRDMNRDLTPGGQGYQTLLHELGHALGLKHPHHEAGEAEHTHLSSAEDNTSFTIMSYNDVGGPYTEFRPYDIAALNWLYGGDGLRGALGLNSTTGGMYITGTSGANTLKGTDGDDLFAGMGGTDIIQGGAGNDTVQFDGARSAYTFSVNSPDDLVAAYAGGTITMSGIELLSFTDGRFSRNDVVNDNVAPDAPQLAVSKNANGYAQINRDLKPIVSGVAEANSLVQVYAGERIVGETRADATGAWQVALEKFADGLNYSVRAIATDGAGNVSEFSEPVSFHIDTTPPVTPTASLTFTEGSNQPSFSGTGEAGTVLHVVDVGAVREIGQTTIKADGTWSIKLPPLPNGSYSVRVSSEDKAGHVAGSSGLMQFTVDNPLNVKGSDAADFFTAAAGDAAIEGGKGMDTIAYAGTRADFTIERTVYGVSVIDKTGAFGDDSLLGIERIEFDNTMVALDINGNAGQVYRLYRALFEREPDPAGLRFWIDAADAGYTLNQISESFLNQEETYALYTDPSDEFFVRALYDHVLQREPDPTGLKYWVDGLKLVSRAEALAFFSESPENKAQVIGSIEHGIEYPLLVA